MSSIFFQISEDFLILVPDLVGLGRKVPPDAGGAILAPLGALAHRIEVARIDFVSH